MGHLDHVSKKRLYPAWRGGLLCLLVIGRLEDGGEVGLATFQNSEQNTLFLLCMVQRFVQAHVFCCDVRFEPC